ENLDLGDVTITGPASYKVGEVFDASKYSATSSKVKNLAVFAALQNEKGEVLSSSEDPKSVTLEKGKVYRRVISLRIGKASDYYIGDVDSVKFNKLVYDDVDGENPGDYTYDFGVDKNSLIIIETFNYYSATDSICYLPGEVKPGVITVTGKEGWNAAGKFDPQFTATCTKGYQMSVHTYLFKKGEEDPVYNSAKPKDFTLEEGEEYTVNVGVYFKGSDLDYDHCCFGNVDAFVMNGESVKWWLSEEQNRCECEYEFTAEKAKEVEKPAPEDPDPKPADPKTADPAPKTPAVEDPKKEEPKQEVTPEQKPAVSVVDKTVKGKKGKKIKGAITVNDAKGKVTYKIVSAKQKKNFKINNKGVITLKKNLKKGTYKVKVQVSYKDKNTKKKVSKKVTVKITVK
nr:hypothetical protein [Lachnospiraceae bacterium]